MQNVLYVLICNGCKEFYIGQTGDKLRNRRTVHDQQIRIPSTRQLPVSAHVDRCCSTDPKYSIFPFYKFHVNDVSARLSKEKYFLNIFNLNLTELADVMNVATFYVALLCVNVTNVAMLLR